MNEGHEYLDSEQVNRAIRAMVDAMAAIEFDHDDDQGLPLRPDVRDYTRLFLCREGLGPLHAGGLPLPAAELLFDGTLSLQWRIGNDIVDLWVPCGGVVRFSKQSAGLRIEETLRHRTPGEAAFLLDPPFDWLRNRHGDRQAGTEGRDHG